MILTATGKTFGDAPDTSGILDSYRDFIKNELGDYIRETCEKAKGKGVSKEELINMFVETISDDPPPGISKQDAINLMSEIINKEMKA